MIPRRDILLAVALVVAASIITYGLLQVADAILEIQKTLAT
jgi:hypothetical protein